MSDGSLTNSVRFGVWADIAFPGPWEHPSFTSPAVVRLYQGQWQWWIYLKDGSIRPQVFGQTGDLPKPLDSDGDGLLDIAVFRPSEEAIYVLRSSDAAVEIYSFGSPSGDYRVRGDFTGDGIEELADWEPLTGMFSMLTSQSGFSQDSYSEMQLGLYFVHLPLLLNRQDGLDLFTVIDHSNGTRYWRADNNENNSVQALQWGLPYIDAQG